MPELCPARDTPCHADAKVRLAELAERQWGVVSHAQLAEHGINRTTIRRWVADRRLHRLHPGVFAVGHPGLGMEARLAAALFYAGRGAALSHVTAGSWLGILRAKPRRIHIAALGKRRSVRGVRVHRRVRVERILHKRLPVTPPAQTLLDIARVVDFDHLRRALAEAEYLKLVTLEEVEGVLGRGKPGSSTLRKALDRHRPQLAKTKEGIEEAFFLLCERHSFDQAEVNVWVAGWLVDAVWLDQKVIVELDSRLAHSSSRSIENDHRRDLALRAAGFAVLRYTWHQVTRDPDLVAADLARHGVGSSHAL
jgi:very-short-patch-repair endonuclease